MKFDLYGHELMYSTGVENYNCIRLNGERLVSNMEQKFEIDYYNKFSDIQGVVNNIEDFILVYLVGIVDWGIEFLNNNGIHKYNRERFFDEFGTTCFESIRNEIKRLKTQYYDIESEQEEARQYREDRKESRGRWEGGGFGLEGAIQGALTAGAANMASGLAHSAVNAIGNAGSSLSAYSKKKEMFENRANVRRLRNAVTHDMRFAYEFIAQIVNDESQIAIEKPEYWSEDVDAQNAVIDNIKNGYIKDRKVILDECAKILQKNPYNEQAYTQFMALCNDPENKIEDMSVYFGVSTIVDAKKVKIKELLDKIDYYNRSNLKDGKIKALQLAKEFGEDTLKFEQCFDSVDRLLEDNDKKVDGFVYDSVDVAKKEKDKIESIVARINNTNGNNIDEINVIIKELEEADFLSKEKYISYLKGVLEEEDTRFRTVLGKLYSTRDEAAQAREDANTLKTAFKNQVIDSEEKFLQLQELVNNIATTDIKEIYATYMEKCKEILEYQKEKIGTTVDFHDKPRKDYAKFFYISYLMYKKTEFIHVMLPEYASWFDNLFVQYRTVNGKLYEAPLDADKAYIKLIEHARSYLKYISETKSEKKSFFGVLKTSVTGIVYKNYEAEYNDVTQNGTKPIPEDKKEDYDMQIKSSATTTGEMLEYYRHSIEDATQRLKLSSKIQDKAINVSRLVEITKPIDASAVSSIMKECCMDISIKDNPKLLEIKSVDNDSIVPKDSVGNGKEIKDSSSDLFEKSNMSVVKYKVDKNAGEGIHSDTAQIKEALDYIKNNFTPSQREEAIKYMVEHTDHVNESLAEKMLDRFLN